MVKFLPVAALALAAAPATVLAAKDKEDAGINRADTAACVSQGNEACGDGKCCMYYHGFGCEATKDGVSTDRFPWMKCYDPSVPVPSSAEGVTDAQIENANAVLDACPPDAAAIEDCEAALADMPAEEDATSAASAVESAAFVAAASIAGIAMGSMMN